MCVVSGRVVAIRRGVLIGRRLMMRPRSAAREQQGHRCRTADLVGARGMEHPRWSSAVAVVALVALSSAASRTPSTQDVRRRASAVVPSTRDICGAGHDLGPSNPGASRPRQLGAVWRRPPEEPTDATSDPRRSPPTTKTGSRITLGAARRRRPPAILGPSLVWSRGVSAPA